MKERIIKLDKDIQEYLSIGMKIGLFNNNNIERIVSRLERVDFSIDNNNPGDAQTVPIRDNSNVRISKGLNVKINEKKTINSEKYYFRDEVVFHELTHCINGLYENWFENLSLWFDLDKLLQEKFNVKEDYINELSKNPQYRQKAYAWLILDEFVAQYVAQLFVEKKYNKKIYNQRNVGIKQSNPIIHTNTNFADYHEFYDLVLKFIEPIYGKNVEMFVKDSLDYTSINKIVDYYKNLNGGFDFLYSLLGEMGNIGFAVASKNFTPEQCASDCDMIARKPENFYNHYMKCLSILDDLKNKNQIIAGVEGHFGNDKNKKH